MATKLEKVVDRLKSIHGFVWFVPVVVSVGLLLSSATENCVTVDEGEHVLSGVLAWEEGRFDYYRVNPPLIKMLVSLPVVASQARISERARWTVTADLAIQGDEFKRDNAENYLKLMVWARFALIALFAVGAWLVHEWSHQLFGGICGFVALTLWCFCPAVLAWAGVCTVDLGASVMGLAAVYAFRYYLHHPSWLTAMLAGWFLGLAMLSKFTLLVLYPILGFVCLLNWWQKRKASGAPWTVGRWSQLISLLLTSVLVIDVVYGFQGVGRQLDSFMFRSHGFRALVETTWMQGTSLQRLPVPLPEQFLQGLDQQISNAEVGGAGYLNGEWKQGGWWYFYLYASGVKLPLGTLAIFAIALLLMLAGARYRLGLVQECLIWLPALAVIALLSWQMRDQYASIRYILPAFPFIFIGISRVGLLLRDAWGWLKAGQLPSPPRGEGKLRAVPVFCGAFIVVAALAWNGVSIWRIHPHHLSYFNELAGGPDNGWRHLIESNIDWGQDLLFLKQWVDRHPEVRPLGLAYYGGMDPHLVGLEYEVPPYGPDDPHTPGPSPPKGEGGIVGPRPGWYAISVNFVCGANFESYDEKGKGISFPPGAFHYFQRFEPVAKARYSIFIYHITDEDANRVRAELGLPPLPEGGKE